MKPDRDDEFEHFKTRINLTAYAAANGYAPDKRSTGRNSFGMKNEGGDKVIIHKLPDGHWYFWSVHSPERGSIIDFVQYTKALNYGQVRVELRPWLSGAVTGPSEPGAWVDDLEPIKRDLGAVRAAWEAMSPLPFGQHPYLNELRNIPASLLCQTFLQDRIRVDHRGNVAFPHFKREGLSGFELKNTDFTGFAKHGQKGLWGSRLRPTDNRLLICENAIDALSYACIRGSEHLRMVSFGGAMSPDQPDLLAGAIKKLPSGTVIIGVDNDEGGDNYSDQICDIFRDIARSDLNITEDRPKERGRDWNDELSVI